MKKLSDLSSKTKLQIGFGLIISTFAILAIVSFTCIFKIDALHKEISTLDHISRISVQLRSDVNRISDLTYEYLVIDDAANRKSSLEQINIKKTSVAHLLFEIDSLLIDYPIQKKEIEILSASFITFNKENETVFSMVNDGKIQEAIHFVKMKQDPLYESIHDHSYNIEKQIDQIAAQHDQENASLNQTVNFTFIILGIGILIITIILAVSISSMITMLKKIADEMRNGVNVLGTSAAEILSTVTEISTGAAETATAVSETTTTVEEVRQTALVSNQKALSLMESSQKAANSVEKGRESINEVIASMKKIDKQMDLISETVLKLSEQNRTIGEITSSVADIADQSNLLAVNAAIEAAKAGEHGRGFTIVAQEIRSLADQSKKATTQVKEILNEINKSVNQAVGVTEQGARTVEEGRNLVASSNEVIEILADNVEEAAQSAIQISSSNQQQMAGMEQIVPAMENIKLASEQNVNGIKQAQLAAHDINNLGQNLKLVIEKFKL
ncbi:MAG: methyl-accepting chemotaxis protein [Bacteroidales bacterium]|nr:methyl-accepting chemotaxis protein [Bacteroidales bacterium]